MFIYLYDVDAAEEILNRCTVTNPDTQNPDSKAYRVAFNFEFVEDTRDKEARYQNTHLYY